MSRNQAEKIESAGSPEVDWDAYLKTYYENPQSGHDQRLHQRTTTDISNHHQTKKDQSKKLWRTKTYGQSSQGWSQRH